MPALSNDTYLHYLMPAALTAILVHASLAVINFNKKTSI